MDPISVLRYCAGVLAEREAADIDRRWQWTIRRKVAVWALSRAAKDSSDHREETLTITERRQIDATHPWLQPIVFPARPAAEITRAVIAQRLERYLAALRQRAAGLIPADASPVADSRRD